jgi:hypothetical protein
LLVGQDLLLVKQVVVLLQDRLPQALRHGLAVQLPVARLSQQGNQAEAQVGQSQLTCLQGFVQQRRAFAIGSAQIRFGHVRLDHGQVAAFLERLGFGLPAGDRRGGCRGRAFAVGQCACHLAGGKSAFGADLGAGTVGRFRWQCIAAGLAAIFVPAIHLLVHLGRCLSVHMATGEQPGGEHRAHGKHQHTIWMRHDSPLWQSRSVHAVVP